MSPMVRVGGRATLDDGDELTWSVADGRRGRRWRAATRHDRALTSSFLLEIGVDGRLARLELSTAAGLLTLHPEPTGALHGNAITEAGAAHITMGWSEDHGLEIEGIPIPHAVSCARLAAVMAVGEGRTSPVVVIGRDLALRVTERRYTRVDATTWRITGDGVDATLAVDGRGLPRWATPTGEWPLELDAPPADR